MDILDARQRFLNSQQLAQQQALSAFGSPLGSFANSLADGALAGLGARAYDIQDYMGARSHSAAPKPTCKIGKVTPKPGYILDYDHPDKVRAKVRTDYTLWQQFLIWWRYSW